MALGVGTALDASKSAENVTAAKAAQITREHAATAEAEKSEGNLGADGLNKGDKIPELYNADMAEPHKLRGKQAATKQLEAEGANAKTLYGEAKEMADTANKNVLEAKVQLDLAEQTKDTTKIADATKNYNAAKGLADQYSAKATELRDKMSKISKIVDWMGTNPNNMMAILTAGSILPFLWSEYQQHEQKVKAAAADAGSAAPAMSQGGLYSQGDGGGYGG